MVLVVDDDEDIRETLRDILIEEGFEVVTAANGAEALEVARESPPCMVILDLMMPVMDGWETFGRLKDDPQLCSVPVCIVSANAGAAPLADCVVSKPVDLNRLLSVVRARC